MIVIIICPQIGVNAQVLIRDTRARTASTRTPASYAARVVAWRSAADCNVRYLVYAALRLHCKRAQSGASSFLHLETILQTICACCNVYAHNYMNMHGHVLFHDQLDTLNKKIMNVCKAFQQIAPYPLFEGDFEFSNDIGWNPQLRG